MPRATAVRHIQFFQLFAGNDEQGEEADVSWGTVLQQIEDQRLSGGPWTMPSADGTFLLCGFPFFDLGVLSFCRVRIAGLPMRFTSRQLKAFEDLGEDDGIADMAHVACFDRNVIAFEKYANGPTITQLVTYLNFMVGHLFPNGQLTRRNLLSRDSLRKLEDLGRPTGLALKLYPRSFEDVPSSLRTVIAREREGVQLETINLRMSIAIESDPEHRPIWNSILQLATAGVFDIKNESIKVYGEDRITGENSMIDLLKLQIEERVSVALASGKSKAISRKAISEAMNNSHEKLLAELDSALLADRVDRNTDK